MTHTQDSKITVLPTTGQPTLQQAATLIEEVREVFNAQGSMPLATAIGVLEIVKAEFLAEAEAQDDV